jgi:hypothetical protein
MLFPFSEETPQEAEFVSELGLTEMFVKGKRILQLHTLDSTRKSRRL